jgi:hypothetical protein
MGGEGVIAIAREEGLGHSREGLVTFSVTGRKKESPVDTKFFFLQEKMGLSGEEVGVPRIKNVASQRQSLAPD